MIRTFLSDKFLGWLGDAQIELVTLTLTPLLFLGLSHLLGISSPSPRSCLLSSTASLQGPGSVTLSLPGPPWSYLLDCSLRPLEPVIYELPHLLPAKSCSFLKPFCASVTLTLLSLNSL